MASSKAASTSSNIQNGICFVLRIANNIEIAVNVFSPPDKKTVLPNFLPGGYAIISIPVFNISSGLVNFKSASPPLNSSLNTILKLARILSNVLTKSLIMK